MTAFGITVPVSCSYKVLIVLELELFPGNRCCLLLSFHKWSTLCTGSPNGGDVQKSCRQRAVLIDKWIVVVIASIVRMIGLVLLLVCTMRDDSGRIPRAS